MESKQLVAKLSISENNITRAHFDADPEIWSYNATLRVWEPVLNACKLMASYHSNPTSRVTEKVHPGVSLNVQSIDAVRLTLAAAALDSLLSAHVCWRHLYTADGTLVHRQAFAADHAVVQTEIENATGLPMQLWMDHGETQKIEDVPCGVVHVVQPLAQAVTRNQSRNSRFAPGILLSICIAELTLQPTVRHPS